MNQNKILKIFGIFFIFISVMFLVNGIHASLTDDLVSYWNFDETSGSTANDSHGSNDLSNNNATINQTGIIDKAYYLNGENSFLNKTAFSELGLENDFSISFWFKADDTSNKRILTTNIVDGNNRVSISLESDIIRGGVYNGSSFNSKSTSFTDIVNWNHIVLFWTASTDTVTVYLNNEIITGTEQPLTYNVSGFEIGRRRGPGGSSQDFFDGLIDEFGIWSRALTSTEVSELYNGGNGLAYPFSDAGLTNPATVNPYLQSTWALIYSDENYSAGHTYRYNFGYNDTNSLNGSETTWQTNQALSADDSSQTFDINQTPTNTDLGTDLYSFVKIQKDTGSGFADYETLWSANTFDVAWTTDANITNPAYKYLVESQLAEQTMTSSSSTTSAYGYRFLTKEAVYIYSTTKHSSSTPTRVLLKTDTGNTVIASATFDGHIATFDEPILLDANTFYRIEADSEGTSYTYRRRASADGFDYDTDYFTFTTGSLNGANTSFPYNLISVDAGMHSDKINKIIPYTEYTWLVDYSNDSNSSDLSYRYTIGYNDTNTLDGSETEWATEVGFTYSTDPIDVNITPTIDDIGNKYIFTTIETIYDSAVVETTTTWSDLILLDVFLNTSIEVEFQNGNDYVVALNDYNYSVHIETEGFPEGHYVEYTWGITDDANISTGTTHTFDTSETLADYDTNTTNYVLEHYIIFDYVGTDWSSFISYDFFDDLSNPIYDTNTFYSADTFDIIFPFVQFTLRDEDGNLIGADVEIKDITNDETYYTDVNSQFSYDLQTLGWDDKEVNLTFTHTSEYNVGEMTYFWTASFVYDINFMMQLNADVKEHEFIVRDTNNNLWTNKYLGFLKAGTDDDIVGIVKTSSTGVASIYLETDGGYDAVLYDATGTPAHLYESTLVTVRKPKDEITLADISPYDLYIGGLLNYNLVNQTDANQSFNIYSGLTDYYSVRVVDYNATISDRQYVPREYLVKVEMGTSYTDAYIIQPYLVSTTDAIIPTIKTINLLGRSVPNVVIIISKFIGDEPDRQIVYSGQTDSTGTLSFSANPLDTYYIDAYHNDELKGSYTVRPRTSADIFWIVIDVAEAVVTPPTTSFVIDWSNTADSIIYLQAPPRINATLKTNTANAYTQIRVSALQDDVVKEQHLFNYATSDLEEDIVYNFDPLNFDSGISKITYQIEVIYNSVVIRTFTKTVSFTREHITSGFVTAFGNMPEELGQPLSAILAIILVVLLLVTLTFSGLPVNPTVITVIGLFAVGFFMMFGFFDTGVTVLGTDIIWTAFIGFAIMTLYLGYREVSR